MIARGTRRQREYHELLGKIAQLENEISMLSRIDNAHNARPSEAGSFDRSLQSFRVELASSSVTTKRQELDGLKAEAADMLRRDPKVAEPLPSPKPAGPPRQTPPPIVLVGIAVVVIGLGVLGFRTLSGPPVVASETLLA